MSRLSSRVLTMLLMLAVSFLCAGCGKPDTAEQPPDGPPREGRGGPRFGGQRGGNSKVRQVMNKVGRGRESLNALLEREVKATTLDWDKIQPQAAEYVRLTAELLGTEPRMGSKESWTQKTTAFADAAKSLDKAAQGKDVKGVRDSQARLAESCSACHRVHRGRGPGGSGFGGPMGFGGPPTRPGQIVPPFLAERLNLTVDQKKQLDDLQKEVDQKLDTILTAEQKRQFRETRPGFGGGGFGRGGGRGRGGRPEGDDDRPPRGGDGPPD